MGSKDWFEAKLLKVFAQNVAETSIHSLVLDVGSVSTVDTSAITALTLIVKELRRSTCPDLKVYFGGWRGTMDDTGISVMEFVKLEQFVPSPYYLTVHAAVRAA